MNNFTISGYTGSKPLRGEGLRICYLTQNISQFRLACASCIGSKHNYVIFSPQKDFEMHVIGGDLDFDPENTQFCFEANSLKSLISTFDILITTIGHFTPAMHGEIKELIDRAITFKIPLIDVPHGLFQFSHNFWDDSKIVNLASSKYGAGCWVDSFCDSKINWFVDRPDGPGYPRFTEARREKQTCVPDYTLITTNSNWYLYDSEWQRSFLRFITEYAFQHSDELIIWAPHPAENNHCSPIRNYIENLLPPNIFIYGNSNQLKFYGIDSTEDLIASCKKGITTVSTCLIDYELNNKNVLVLTNNATENLAKSLKSASTIKLPLQPENPLNFTKLKTGLLFPYDVKIFDKLIDSSL